jgi:hypothetical protein
VTENWLTREANCAICVRKSHKVCPGHPVKDWKGWCSDYVTPDEADNESPVRYRRCWDCGRAHDWDFCTRIDWESAEAEDPHHPQWTCDMWIPKSIRPGGCCISCQHCEIDQVDTGHPRPRCTLRGRIVSVDTQCVDWKQR